MQEIEIIFSIIILIMSVVVHEVSHGYAALFFGDETARHQGRLTLNPLKHLDLTGSVIVPLLLIISGSGFVFGWAKPVPINPYNFRNRKWAEVIVALAGPLSNISLAVIFGLLIRFGDYFGILSPSFLYIAGYVVLINLVLAIFNLIPIPPLDGSHLLFSFLSERYVHLKETLQRFGFVFILIFIIFIWPFLVKYIFYITSLITGQ
ncbi:MAG: site-2 protease family protein [Patescibacteria group bacterium]